MANVNMNIKYSEPSPDEFTFDMEKWNDNEREIIKLFLEKNNLRDIADMMDLNYSTVKSIWQRLKIKLFDETEIVRR